MQKDEKSQSEFNDVVGTHVSSEFYLAMNFFNRLNLSSVPYCLLSGYNPLEKKVPSDLDFMVPPRDVTLCGLMIHDFCQENQLRLIQVLEHEVGGVYYVVNWRHAGRELYLALDVCGDYRRRGHIWLRAEGMINRRQIDDAGVYRAAPEDALLYYIIKRTDKNDLGASQIRRLRNLAISSEQRGINRLKPYLGETLTGALLSHLAKGSDEQIIRLLPQLRKRLHRSRPPEITRMDSFVAKVSEMARRWRRWTHPTGMTIAILGPDGSGKSSVIEETLKLIEPAFRKAKTVHLRPRVLNWRSSSVEAITQPHAKMQRGVILSVFKVAYFAMDYVFGWNFLIRPLTRRSTIIVFDRYFHDIVIDPKRFRYGGPMWLVRLISKVVPQPDLIFVLDAPTTVLQSRKTEVPPAETERQRLQYVAITQKGSAFLVDASEPLPSVSQKIAERLLNYLNNRTLARIDSQ